MLFKFYTFGIRKKSVVLVVEEKFRHFLIKIEKNEKSDKESESCENLRGRVFFGCFYLLRNCLRQKNPFGIKILMKLHNFRILPTLVFLIAIFTANAGEISKHPSYNPRQEDAAEATSSKNDRDLAVDVSNYKNFEKLIDGAAMVGDILWNMK